MGATIDPDRRYKEHKRDGKRGTFNFADTKNMKRAEQSLLDVCKTCSSSNTQSDSNVREEEGYVYTIRK